jgi:hypothetical protein
MRRLGDDYLGTEHILLEYLAMRMGRP